MDITCRFYDELHKDCVYIREEVFVKEQGFQYEFDDIDHLCRHAVFYIDGQPVATGRTFCKDGVWYVGRIAVMPEYRGRDIGSKMVRTLEAEALRQGAESTTLAAQCRAAGFYEKLGYIQTNDHHDEEGIPHVMMIKKL